MIIFIFVIIIIIKISHITKALKELEELTKAVAESNSNTPTTNDNNNNSNAYTSSKIDEEEVMAMHAKKAALQKRYVALVHGLTQALLAIGLLQLLPFKPRVTGTFGIITSALVRKQQ